MDNKELSKIIGSTSNSIKIPVIQRSLGAKPSVSITNTYNGFDWDSGTTFLETNKDIQLATHEKKEFYSEDIKLSQTRDSYKLLTDKRLEEVISKLTNCDNTNIGIEQLRDIEDIINQTNGVDN